MPWCEKPQRTRDWCPGHYARWRKYGDPEGHPLTEQAEGRPDEVWAGIPDLAGYEASTHGRIRSIGRWVTGEDGVAKWFSGRQMALADNEVHGRLYIGLAQRSYAVHVLVARTFLGPRPSGLHVCHNDGDAYNNHVSNLRYDTPAANAQDTLKHGRNPRANQVVCKRNHPLTGPGADVHVNTSGRRQCRPCVRIMRQVRRANGAAG